MSSDYYSILGITPTASADEVKKLYKKLAVKFHPDKTNDPNLHRKFILINEAYETLKDSALRQAYDTKIGVTTSESQYPSHTSNVRSHHGYSYYLSGRFGGGYFNWQQLNARAYTDAYNRRTHEADIDPDADAAVRMAQQKMREELERRRREYMFEAQKTKERERRERIERELAEMRAREMAEAMRKRESAYDRRYEMYRGDTPKEEYRKARQQAQRRWFGLYEVDELDLDERHEVDEDAPGHDSTKPIIVEDEGEVAELLDEEEDEVEADDDLVVDEVPVVPEDVKDTEEGDFDEAVELENLDLFEDCVPPQETADDSFPDQTFRREEPETPDVVEVPYDDIYVQPPSPQRFPPPNRGKKFRRNMETGFRTGYGGNQENAHANGSFRNRNSGATTSGSEASDTADAYTNPGPSSANTGSAASYVPGSAGFASTSNGADPAPNVDVSTGAPRQTESESTSNPRSRRSLYAHAAKKPRFDWSDMRQLLGPDLEDVSFDDLRDNLPDSGDRTRKASGSIQSSTKRPRKQFTDGTARSQTLFTPLNRLAKFPPATISPADLTPDCDESVILFTESPPQIDVGLSITHAQWEEYVENMRQYERRFAAYRQAVMRYQIGRMEKDERHHNVIYSDTACVDPYVSCLFNDLLMVQSYHRALLEFRMSLKIFKRNCEMVNAISEEGMMH